MRYPILNADCLEDMPCENLDFFRFHSSYKAARYLYKINPEKYWISMKDNEIGVAELVPVKVNGVSCRELIPLGRYSWESPEKTVDLRNMPRWRQES